MFIIYRPSRRYLFCKMRISCVSIVIHVCYHIQVVFWAFLWDLYIWQGTRTESGPRLSQNFTLILDPNLLEWYKGKTAKLDWAQSIIVPHISWLEWERGCRKDEISVLVFFLGGGCLLGYFKEKGISKNCYIGSHNNSPSPLGDNRGWFTMKNSGFLGTSFFSLWICFCFYWIIGNGLGNIFVGDAPPGKGPFLSAWYSLWNSYFFLELLLLLPAASSGPLLSGSSFWAPNF